MLKLYSTSIGKRYYQAPVCSIATFISVLFLIIILVLPFILAYSAGDIWIKEGRMVEQPLVELHHTVIAEIEAIDTDLFKIFYSSDVSLWQRNQGRTVTIKTYSIDEDQDGLFDVLVVNGSFPVLPNEKIHRVRIALGAQVSIRKRIRVTTEGMIYVDVASPLPGKSVSIDGHVQLKQPGLITEGYDYHYLDPVFDFQDFSWKKLVSDYHDRDCITC